MFLRFILFFIALHFTIISSWGQHNDKITTIDFVQILNEHKKEAIYYYENNWKVLREMATINGHIHSYQLLETPYTEEAPFDLMLMTTYQNKTQYDLREKHFAELIAEKGELNLMNVREPREFRKILFNKTMVRHRDNQPKSTKDLSFLIGEWEVIRIYSPNSDQQRTYNGTLVCEESLDGQFIKCVYEMQRPDKIRGLDVVYFNYNNIYNLYESVWLSSTWPIKGMLQGDLKKDADQLTLNTSGQFKIENEVTEYVKDELILGTKEEELNSFTRKTLIRTSEYEAGVWHHHMTETATRRKKEIKNTSEKNHFDKIGNYLSAGSGKWTGPNKKYDSKNPKSPKAFGLWFERPINNLLTLKIVAYFKDTTLISSQGTFSYNPIKKQFIHVTADRGNGFSEGVTTFPNDSTFISTMINYHPDGSAYGHKDENFIISDNLHKNISFKKDEQGNWVEQGQWTWTRDALK